MGNYVSSYTGAEIESYLTIAKNLSSSAGAGSVGVTADGGSDMQQVVTSVESRLDTAESDITSLESRATAIEAWDTDNIPNESNVTGTTTTAAFNTLKTLTDGHTEDISDLDTRIDNIVGYAGTSTVEVVDARYSTEKDVTFSVLGDRINSLDQVTGYNVKDHGLVGNGSDDDSSELNALITALGSTPSTLYFPRGTYKLNDNVSVPSTIELKFVYGAMLKPASGKAITGSNTKISAGLYQIFDLSLSGSSGVAGTWKINKAYPEWFGAVGDGSTDDSTYINYGVSFLNLNGGGVYQFDNKTYIVGTPINLRSKIIYRGKGHATIIKQKPSVVADNIFGEASPSSGISGVIIEHMLVDGTKDNSTHPADDANGNGIRFNQVIYSTIRHCIIQNIKNNALSIYNSSNDNIIENNIIVDNGATSGLPGTYSRNGVFIEFDCSRNKVIKNRVSNNADCGIWSGAQGAENNDNIIDGNWVVFNGSDGIWIGDNSGSSTAQYRNKIVNNYVASNTSVGIRINHAGSGTLNETIIQGNNVLNNGSGGIYMQDHALKTIVMGNVCLTNTGDGIGIGGDASDTLVLGNICLSNTVNQLGTSGTRTIEIANITDTANLIRSTLRIQSEDSLKVSKSSGNAADLILAQAGVLDWTIRNAATTGKLAMYDGTVSIMELDNTPSAEDTALLIYVNDGGSMSLKQVSMGADDSGGTGYRLLRVTN